MWLGGHKAKECDKGDFCVLCKVIRNRVGAGKCPEFKMVLKRVRTRKKRRKTD